MEDWFVELWHGGESVSFQQTKGKETVLQFKPLPLLSIV
jgi:hypothetical protein